MSLHLTMEMCCECYFSNSASSDTCSWLFFIRWNHCSMYISVVYALLFSFQFLRMIALDQMGTIWHSQFAGGHNDPQTHLIIGKAFAQAN